MVKSMKQIKSNWFAGQKVTVNIRALYDKYGEKLKYATIKPPQKSTTAIFEIYSKGPNVYVASEMDIGTITKTADNYIVIDYMRSYSKGNINMTIAVGLQLTHEEAEIGLGVKEGTAK